MCLGGHFVEGLSSGTLAAIAGLLGGALLGFAARWGRFCTLGAIEDLTFGGSSVRLRMWLLAVAFSMLGVHGLDQLGLLSIADSFYVSNPTSLWANAIGGLIFGIGMAFVGPCGFGALARLGGGDLKSLVTFLVMGISAYATLRGLTAYARIYVFPPVEQPDTPASFSYLFANALSANQNIVAFGIAVLLAIIALTKGDLVKNRKQLITAALVGAAIVIGWAGSGIFAHDDFDPQPLESFTFTAPLGETLIYVMTATGSSLNLCIGATIGVIVGAFITTKFQTYFRWEACDDAREMRRQVIGGFLMGVGGVTALGCTVGQGLSAASVLAYSAPVTMAGIFIGAWLGLQWLVAGMSFTQLFTNKLNFLKSTKG